jgi:hypothetical protein
MGYGIEFWAGSVDEILQTLQNPTVSNVSDEVIARWAAMAEEHLEEEVSDMRTLLSKSAAALLSSSATNEPEIVEKLLVVALVRHHGALVGSTQHSGRGGDDFRTFVAEFGESVYGLPKEDLPGNLLELLTSRTFGEGHAAEDYPCWGYLTKKELEACFQRRKNEKASSILEEADDNAEWFSDIDASLKAALTQGKDVLCIYT